MIAKVFKDGEWKEATKDDFIKFVKDQLNVDVKDLDKVNVRIKDKWVKGTELVKGK